MLGKEQSKLKSLRQTKLEGLDREIFTTITHFIVGLPTVIGYTLRVSAPSCIWMGGYLYPLVVDTLFCTH